MNATDKPVNVRVAEAIGHRVEKDKINGHWLQFSHNTADGFERWSHIQDYEHNRESAFGALEAVLSDETVCCTITLMKDAATVILTKSKSVNDLSAKRIGVGENQRLPAAITTAIIAACEKEEGRG